MLFIDAQQYLDLYRMSGGKALLEPLAEVRGAVFVTEQVTDEVARRKLEVAAGWLAGQFTAAAAEFAALNEEFRDIKKEIPEHLFSPKVTAALKTKLTDFKKAASAMHRALREYKEDVARAVGDLLEQISRSEDEVSKALAVLFHRPVEATQEEVQAGRLRRETGRAPGKKADPLGDQISWEQILRRIKDCPRLWITSRDRDYCEKHADRTFLNAAMYQELKRLNPGIEVRCFSEMERGLRDFISASVMPSPKLLPNEEAEKINKEQETLPPLSGMAGSGDGLFTFGGYPTAMSGSLIRPGGVTVIDPNAQRTRLFNLGTTVQAIPTRSGFLTPPPPMTSD
jgi:hypothetical protein